MNLDEPNSENAGSVKVPLIVDCYSKVSKDLFSGGVKNLLILSGGEKLIVAAGNGQIEMVEILTEAPKADKIILKSYTASTTTVKSPNKPLIKTVRV